MRKTQFLGLAPGGRYAVFGFGAIDLWTARVAWIQSWIAWPAATRMHVIAVDSPTEDWGLKLFDLRTGVGPEFAGERVPHYVLAPELVALQRMDAIVLVNTLDAREVLKLPVERPVLSLVAADGSYYALWEWAAEPDADKRSFELLRFDAATGQLLGDEPVALDYGTLSPPLGTRRSQPFLAFDAEHGIQVCVASDDGAAGTPLRWYRRALRGSGAWEVSEVGAGDQVTLARLPQAFIPSARRELPPQLAHDLARLSETAIGWTKGPQRGLHFVTGDATRDCAWSLLEGRRVRCDRAGEIAPPDRPARLPCRLEIDASNSSTVLGALPITCDAKLLATAYDLGADDWALVLPDGRYSGSVRVHDYLAFYRADGSLLNAAEMAALRLTPAELATVVSAQLRARR